MERSEVPAEFTANTGPMMTVAQKSYLLSLLDDRDIPDDAREQMFARVHGDDVTKARASDWIKRLLAKPKRAINPANPVGKISVQYEEHQLDDGEQHRIGYVVGAGPHRVPRGRYALDTTGDDRFVNDTNFFKLWVGTRGGWKLSLQSSDDEYPLDKWETKRWVIEQIAKDPEEAMRRYGRELKVCGMCGKTLTNDVSRELGIGPVCRTRL